MIHIKPDARHALTQALRSSHVAAENGWKRSQKEENTY